MILPGRKNKYGNRKTEVDGIKFDSWLEAHRYGQLKLLERAGKISRLELQPVFVLQEGFTYNGKRIQAIKYKGDFKYIENGRVVVEDSKGYPTPEYKIKKKLLLRKYDIDFREV